jgi:hypothetical protein
MQADNASHATPRLNITNLHGITFLSLLITLQMENRMTLCDTIVINQYQSLSSWLDTFHHLFAPTWCHVQSRP